MTETDWWKTTYPYVVRVSNHVKGAMRDYLRTHTLEQAYEAIQGYTLVSIYQQKSQENDLVATLLRECQRTVLGNSNKNFTREYFTRVFSFYDLETLLEEASLGWILTRESDIRRAIKYGQQAHLHDPD